VRVELVACTGLLGDVLDRIAVAGDQP